MKTHHCKLDEVNNITVELIKRNSGKTILSIVDKTSKPSQMCYNHVEFCQIFTEVDRYRLLELADFIYEYCKADR
jgi:hypothetical protein